VTAVRDPTWWSEGEDGDVGAASAASTAPVLRPVPTPEDDSETGTEGRQSGGEVATVWSWVGWFRPPDIWDTPAPTLREEWERTLKGAHLPTNVWLRRAEVARQAISIAIIACLLMLVHVNRSAGRQAVALLVVAALAVSCQVAA